MGVDHVDEEGFNASGSLCLFVREAGLDEILMLGIGPIMYKKSKEEWKTAKWELGFMYCVAGSIG